MADAPSSSWLDSAPCLQREEDLLKTRVRPPEDQDQGLLKTGSRTS